MLDGFDQSFEVLNKKDLFVRAFAHHISEALKKKEIVTIKHRGGFVGGPSPDLKSQYRIRVFFVFFFLGLLWIPVSIRMYETTGRRIQLIGLPILGVLHTVMLIFELEACVFYETYSKYERVTLVLDIMKYILLYQYIIGYDNGKTRRTLSYIMLIPFFQKIWFYFQLRRKFVGLYSSQLNIWADFLWICIFFRAAYIEIKWGTLAIAITAVTCAMALQSLVR